MQFLAPLFSSVLLLLLAFGVASDSTNTRKYSTTICATYYGSTSVVPVTVTSTRAATTVMFTVTSTSTPVVKISGVPVTKTCTRKTKTKVTITGSALSTDTITTTTTITLSQTVEAPTPITTETATATSTTTVIPTSTAASPSVAPIQDTLPGSSLKKRSQEDTLLRRVSRKRSALAPLPRADTSQSSPNATGFPQSVKCNVNSKVALIVISTVTAPTKTVTLCPKTTVLTTTTTLTSTSTIYPSLTATIITSSQTTTDITTTTPATLTTTTTTTTTATTFGEAATVYPQCDPRNQALRYNGQLLNFFSFRTSNGNYISQSVIQAPDVASCCIACLNTPNCGASLLFDGSTQCRLLNLDSGTCTPDNQVQDNLVINDDPRISGFGAYFSNGKCITFTGVVHY